MTILLSNDILTILTSYITPYSVKSKLKIYVNKRGKYIIKGYGFNKTKKLILEIMKQKNKENIYSYIREINPHWFNVDDLHRETTYHLGVAHQLSPSTIRNNLLAMEGLYVKRAEYGDVAFNYWNDGHNRHYWYLIDNEIEKHKMKYLKIPRSADDYDYNYDNYVRDMIADGYVRTRL